MPTAEILEFTRMLMPFVWWITIGAIGLLILRGLIALWSKAATCGWLPRIYLEWPDER